MGNTSDILHLIKVAREGDLYAFEQIMRLYERRIFGYVMRHVNNREDAEDITQEVFIKLYKKFESYNEEQTFTTWLFTIATNTIYDFLRRRRGKQDLLIVDDPDQSFETADKTDTYKAVEAFVDVEQGLSKIKTTYRTVLLLFYRDELTCEEIADALKIPVGTVKTHLSRARKSLKEVL